MQDLLVKMQKKQVLSGHSPELAESIISFYKIILK